MINNYRVDTLICVNGFWETSDLWNDAWTPLGPSPSGRWFWCRDCSTKPALSRLKPTEWEVSMWPSFLPTLFSAVFNWKAWSSFLLFRSSSRSTYKWLVTQIFFCRIVGINTRLVCFAIYILRPPLSRVIKVLIYSCYYVTVWVNLNSQYPSSKFCIVYYKK